MYFILLHKISKNNITTKIKNKKYLCCTHIIKIFSKIGNIEVKDSMIQFSL